MILYILLIIPIIGIFLISSIRSYNTVIWEQFATYQNNGWLDFKEFHAIILPY